MVNRIKELIVRAIDGHNMLDGAEKIVVGFSGGADSTALLHYLKNNFNGQVVAAHVNHHLRGEESERDMLHCESFCNENDIELKILNADIKAMSEQSGESIEECGRRVRYEFFNSLCDGNTKIATAHTLSDSCETMLFNMARGTGVKGMCGIPFVRGNIVRPLRLLTREQVEQYCEHYSLSYVTDSTNSDIIYSRNRIRRNVIPELKEINGSVLSAMERLSAQLTEQQVAIDEIADELLLKAKTDGGLSFKVLNEAPKAVVSSMIVRFLREQDVGGISSDKLSKVCEIIKSGSGAVTFGAHRQLRAEQGLLVLTEQGREKISFEAPFKPDTEQYIVELDAYICTKTEKNFKNTEKNKKIVFHNLLDYDTINKYAVFRSRRDGDVFEPAGRGCTKSVKKLMQEKHIPPSNRDSVVMLEQDGGIIWSSMFGAAEGFAATEGTETAVSVTIRKEEQNE